jgi:ribosomal protein S18 acetylase RimI-like enzyme
MVTLDPVRAENVQLFKAVRLRALQDSPSAFGSTYAREVQFSDDEWLARAERWNGERGIGFLAMEDGVPCGIAGGLLDAVDPIEPSDALALARAHLVSMWTASTHRQRGVGRLLVDAVATWARRYDVSTVLLSVVSTNEAAISFYLRLGFTMTGKTEPYPNDPALIEYEMALVL